MCVDNLVVGVKVGDVLEFRLMLFGVGWMVVVVDGMVLVFLLISDVVV